MEKSKGSVFNLGSSVRTLKLERVVQSITMEEPSLSFFTAWSHISRYSYTCASKVPLAASGRGIVKGERTPLVRLRLASIFSRMALMELRLDCSEWELTLFINILWGGWEGRVCMFVLAWWEIIIDLCGRTNKTKTTTMSSSASSFMPSNKNASTLNCSSTRRRSLKRYVTCWRNKEANSKISLDLRIKVKAMCPTSTSSIWSTTPKYRK